MYKLIHFVTSSLLFLNVSHSGAVSDTREIERWYGAVQNNIEFFDRFSWDEVSGSYASDLNADGEHLSDNRHIVALSRMAYANSKAPNELQNLKKAEKIVNFILNNMVSTDNFGPYFKSTVNSKGEEISSGRSYTFSFEQSYPIAGFLALYNANPLKYAHLLPFIRKASISYWSRFHDDQKGGMFYYFNFLKRNHSNDSGEIHKSYQSNIYPITSFMFELRKADPSNKNIYDCWINELLEVATNHIIEYQSNKMTGWLIERMSNDFTPDPTYTMSESGHITQLSWVLGIAVTSNVVKDRSIQKKYLAISKSLLSNFIQHSGFSSMGVVYDAFDRTNGKPILDSNGKATSAWWSNLEAVIAFSFAKKEFKKMRKISTQVLNNLTNAYFLYFVDSQNGGEYFRINAENGNVVDSTKGGPGKSGYHILETYLYLIDFTKNEVD